MIRPPLSRSKRKTSPSGRRAHTDIEGAPCAEPDDRHRFAGRRYRARQHRCHRFGLVRAEFLKQRITDSV